VNRCRFLAKSALDFTWMDGIDASKGLFVTAQGLLMYFEEHDVRSLLQALFDRFPGVEVMFDTTPRWFSRKTLRGFHKTPHYRAPPMPWGIDRGQIEPTLRSWSSWVREVTIVPYGARRGLLGLLLKICSHLPWLQNFPPSIVHLRTESSRV
jgi:O-methyltransferase involved in polyketide biosynthesis